MLVIDHRDSFTWNLVDQLRRIDQRVRVVEAAELVWDDALLNPGEVLVLSPGPGCPADYPATLAAYRAARETHPILGVCLGFQTILAAEGGRIQKQDAVLHGVQTEACYERASRTYAGWDGSLQVGRYHSLCLAPESLPEGFTVTARDQSTQVILSVEHRELPIYGLQYHPDSFLTPRGDELLKHIFTHCLGL